MGAIRKRVDAVTRAAIIKVLRADPTKSNNSIGREVGYCGHQVVGRIRAELEARGELPRLKMIIDVAGHKRPLHFSRMKSSSESSKASSKASSKKQSSTKSSSELKLALRPLVKALHAECKKDYGSLDLLGIRLLVIQIEKQLCE